MPQYAMVIYVMVWYAMVIRNGMVWYGMVIRNGMLWYGIWYSTFLLVNYF